MPGKQNYLLRLLRHRKAATAVEYGFLIAMIAMAIMAALFALGSQTSSMWGNVSDKVQKAG
jgi:pilus assembly protein Flp/PilA